MKLISTCKKTLLLLMLTTCSTVHAQHGLEWAQRMGGYRNDRCGRIALDTEGNVYTTGTIVDSVDFGDGTFIKGYQGNDVFISKHNAVGTLVWAKIFGGAGDDQSNHITVDKADNIYITGSFTDTAYFNGTNANGQLNSLGGADIFLLKLDIDGNFIWVKQFGSTVLEQGWAIKYHPESNNLYTAGIFFGTLTFGNTTMTNIAGSGADIYNIKLDTAGNVLWAKQFDGTAANACRDMGVDSVGNVYTTGYFQGLTDFDPDTSALNLVSLGGNDVFIVKLNAEGKLVWAKQFAGVGEQLGFGIAVDKNGNNVTTGRLRNAGFFLPNTGDTLRSKGNDDAFIVKMDADGNYLWGQSYGSTSFEDGTGVTIDQVGNIYFTGFFRGTVDFNPRNPDRDTIVSFDMTGADIFIAKLDAAGNYNWAYGIGSRNGDAGSDVAVNSRGDVYVAGTFTYTVDFDPGSDSLMLSVPLPTSQTTPYTDVFVLKLVCKDSTTSTLTIEDCESVIFDGITYNTSGEYNHHFMAQNGCDSNVYLQVTITEMEKPTITVDSFTLGTSISYSTYQWYKNGVLIPGATNSTYTVSENAEYKVVVTNEKGCTDTSEIYPVTNVPQTGITTPSLAAEIMIYPNPTTGIIRIKSPIHLNIVLYTLEGRQIGHWEKTETVNVQDYAKGLYLMECRNTDGILIKTEKIIVQ